MAQLLWDTVHVTSPRKKMQQKMTVWPVHFTFENKHSATESRVLRRDFTAPSLSNRVLAIAKLWKPLTGA